MQPQTEMNWEKYLRLFSEQNRNRPTRIGVFKGDPPAITDLWLEDGLPFAGINVDAVGETGTDIDILLDNGPDQTSHMTHRISGAKVIRIILSDTEEDDGLDIENHKGDRTVLRFEHSAICGERQ